MLDVRTVVVIPAGPRDDIADTVDSVLTYLGPSRHVVVVDDTRGARAQDVAALEAEPAVTMLRPGTGGEGTYGSLWVKLGAALEHVRSAWRPELVIRLDADALLIGDGLEDAALARFAAEPDLGLLGSYRTGPDGGTRSFAPASALLKEDLAWRNVVRDRARRRAVARLHRHARRHGYQDGEHVLGAVSLLPGRALERLFDIGALCEPALGRSAQGDDHLLGLAVRAAGMRIGDLGRPGDPVAVRWKGLPASPEELLARGVAATHSVRSYGDMGEEQVRAAFRAARRSAPGPGGGPPRG